MLRSEHRFGRGKNCVLVKKLKALRLHITCFHILQNGFPLILCINTRLEKHLCYRLLEVPNINLWKPVEVYMMMFESEINRITKNGAKEGKVKAKSFKLKALRRSIFSAIYSRTKKLTNSMH